MMNLNTLGKNIKHYRGKMSQEQFAVSLNITKSKLSSIETNKRLPNLDEFKRICTTTCVSADKLLGLPPNLKYPTQKVKSLGTKLIDLRNSLTLNQGEFAKKIDVSKATLSKYESDNRLPPLNRIRSICEQFQISADYLLNLKKEF